MNVQDEQGMRADRLDHPDLSLGLSGKLEGTGSQLLNRPFILASEVEMRIKMLGSVHWTSRDLGDHGLRSVQSPRKSGVSLGAVWSTSIGATVVVGKQLSA